MTAYRPGRYAVIGCRLKQNANEGCNSCASLSGLVLSFIACFILLVIAPLTAVTGKHSRIALWLQQSVGMVEFRLRMR